MLSGIQGIRETLLEMVYSQGKMARLGRPQTGAAPNQPPTTNPTPLQNNFVKNGQGPDHLQWAA